MSDDLTRTSHGGPAPEPGHTPLPHIGHYRVLRVIGEGGMGTVYEAEQENPRRIVALKVIRPGFATGQLLRRSARSTVPASRPDPRERLD